MPTCRVLIEVEDATGASRSALANAWVYWKQGDTITTLRTNATGMLALLTATGAPTLPASYGSLFSTSTGAQVDVHYSRGAKPTPRSKLDENGDAFVRRTVTLPPPGQEPVIAVPIAANAQNTVTTIPVAVVRIPRAQVSLTKPAELSIWPLLREPYDDAYATQGLAQGAALWTAAGKLTVTEGGNAAAPAPDARPKERGLIITGAIAASVTSAEMSILRADGSSAPLRTSATATGTQAALPLQLGTPSGAVRPFQAELFLSDPATTLGPVQVMVRSTAGATPRIVASYACHLAGVQLALCVDAANGARTQSPPTEHADVVVVDFLRSPQADKPQLAAQTRARRMVCYPIELRERALSTAGPVVAMPEMPLWMAEMHLVGLACVDIEDLLVRRRDRNGGTAVPLTVALGFELKLGWDGPDVAAGGRAYSYAHTLASPALAATLEIDQGGRLKNKDAPQSTIDGALQPRPAHIPFPVPGRRVATVRLDEPRAWGRQHGAATRPSLIVEWQAKYEEGGKEIIRGGNGSLLLPKLTIDGVSSADAVTASTGTLPVASLPAFRVPGRNPTQDALRLLSDTLVDSYYNTHSTVDRVTILTRDCWKATIRAIFFHEAGYQFDERGSVPRRFSGRWYGHEKGMPIFGAPHGYGTGQLDNPPVNDNTCWSFLENVKACVALLMQDKGAAAWRDLHAHFSATPTRRDRAVFRREIVRRYNGFTEFLWDAASAQFVISPTNRQWDDEANHAKGANNRLPYPNRALGTNVVYFNGTGAATTFPWPIAFTEADFGPDL